MAKTKAQAQPVRIKQEISRPGVHAKTKMSNLKASKNYHKKYKGQGR